MGFSLSSAWEDVKGGAKDIADGGGLDDWFAGAGRMASPFTFGLSREFGDFFAGALDPGRLNAETSQNELFKKVGQKPAKLAPTDTEGKARWAAFHGALGDLKRRRGSLTTLTSGLGLSGSPATTAVTGASSLLGF